MNLNLRTKLTATLLFVSLVSAVSVGGTAYWMLMRDFHEAAAETAFKHFRADMEAYLQKYGSWEQARQSEPFREFARHRHMPSVVAGGAPMEGMPPEAEAPGSPGYEPSGGGLRQDERPAVPRRMPPFRFLLIDPEGHVVRPAGDYQLGQVVGDDIRRIAQPISVNGRVEVLAVPVGIPQLSVQDGAYLNIMRKALMDGMIAAGLLAIVLGLLIGGRFSRKLQELIAAIRAMRPGDMSQQVPVRSHDEMGELATAFNRMSGELAQAHAALQRTTEQVQAQAEQLKELSIRDPLTQLFNRRHFDEQTELLYRHSLRYGRPLCVMVGDLDHFKAVNDTFSHAIGDEVLRRVAKLMQQNIRSSDLVARYGGEEFVIAFVESTLEQAVARCEALRSSIESHPWAEIHPDLRVTMSMGLCDDTSLDSVEKMLAAADACLYEAKHGGRNRVAYAPRKPAG